MGIRADRKQKTRQSLLHSALKLSSEQGFSCLSLREVTREAGIAPTSFYRHFKDMEDLGLALVDEIALMLRQLLRQSRRRVRVKRGAVRASIETFMEFLDRNEEHFRLLIGERTGAAPRVLRSEIKKETQRFIQELAEDLYKDSEISGRPIINPKLVAEMMTTIALNTGIEALRLPAKERIGLMEDLVTQMNVVLLGAEALALGWKPGRDLAALPKALPEI
ncbi:MAG: HTH-type transcriptional repressor FabR [Oligoflexus sp.]